MFRFLRYALFAGMFLKGYISGQAQQAIPDDGTPNVVIVLTDDQGIGDLSCHGNPWLKTPFLDGFYENSFRLTNFHVSPLCTPTRGAIMTGKYPIHNGAWATFKGRDALSPGELTLAQAFKQSGYRTGLFGKWHLGDNYPVRPTDCGFDIAVQHMAGGVGELSDYWGNDYFDDVYYVNNEPTQFSGYCTDIWFEEAMKFMDSVRDQPFFAYISTNAPHAPLVVPDPYQAPYVELEGKQIPSAAYYGMIANIDENFGKLLSFLKEKGLEEHTLVIFMTDNGTQFGFNESRKLGFNKGFRGNKGGKLEGAHRVPFFMRWPRKGISGGKDINSLLAHVDLLPTLSSLCGLKIPIPGPNWDGIDFSPLFEAPGSALEQRTLFIHHRQDWRPPEDETNTCIMREEWRLIGGEELYYIEQDPRQINDLSHEFPELVARLLEENANYLAPIKQMPSYRELPVHTIGNPAQAEIKLTIQHAIGEDAGIWKPEQVAAGVKNRNNTHALSVERSGLYRISCRRWPKECPGPIRGIPSFNPQNLFEYQRIRPEKVQLQIANQMLEKDVQDKEEEVLFDVWLEPGKTLLIHDFLEGQDRYGVYYTYITYLGKN